MSLSVPVRVSFVVLGAVLVLSVCPLVWAASPAAEITRALAAEVGSFHQTQALKPSDFLVTEGFVEPTAGSTKAAISSQAFEAEYASAQGDKFKVLVARLQSDSEAYSLLTLMARGIKHFESIKTGDIGTADFIDHWRVVFCQGANVVSVTGPQPDAGQTIDFARLLAAQLDKGEDEIPALAKHLPDAPRSLENALYIVHDQTLRQEISGAPVLGAVSLDGGAEAVTADYGRAQLLIVEFTTPQFSIDYDSRIWTKIAELKSQGLPTPTAYRRVGNYSVFVFNAPDEQTANALIDQVKYEQVVQWLGDDPHLYERMQRYLTQTSAGVLVAVVKSSGLSLILCLGLGGLVGALLFRHRRAQRAAAFSDAGGGTRLNLDELTGSPNTRPLLSSPKRSHEDPTS